MKLQGVLSNYPLRVFFASVAPVIAFFRRPGTDLSSVELPESERGERSSQRLKKYWDLESLAASGSQPESAVAASSCPPDSAFKPSLLRALRKTFWREFALLGMLKFAWSAVTVFAAYYLLREIVSYMTLADDQQEGLLYAGAILIDCVLASIFINHMYFEGMRVGMRIRAALMDLVYRKCLVISRFKGGAGDVVNLLATHCARIGDAALSSHYLWTAALEVIAIFSLAAYELGVVSLAGIGVFLLFLPLQLKLGASINASNECKTSLTTERVHLVSEILTAIKLIKYYAWESYFRGKVLDQRTAELAAAHRTFIFKVINFTLVFALPVVIAVLCLSLYVFTGNTLTPAVAFTIISLFNILRYPLLMLPQAIKNTAATFAALPLLESFLLAPEIDRRPRPEPKDPDVLLEMQDAAFSWSPSVDDSSKASVRGCSFALRRGQIMAVVGATGSGKSSLVAAILGQITRVGGHVAVRGSVAFAPQEAWLYHGTLRDNILFGSEYEPQRFERVISVCQLERDLELLGKGDSTEIAERGSNLSGGQRQRVNVARAAYAASDIAILDDPLSALDQSVGRNLFEQCIKSHLAQRAVVLVTHQLQYLDQCDLVVVMKDGLMAGCGTYEELLENPNFTYLRDLSGHCEVPDDIKIDAHAEASDNDLEDVDKESESSAGGKHSSTGLLEIAPSDALLVAPGAGSGSKPGHAKAKMDTLQVTRLAPNELTLCGMNQATISRLGPNEILAAIEANNLTFSPYHTADIRRAIEVNELTLHNIDELLRVMREGSGSGKMAAAEQPEEEKLGWRTYRRYAGAPPGTTLALLCVGVFFFVHALRVASDYWLSLWPSYIGGFSDGVYVGVYSAGCVLFALGVYLRGVFFAWQAHLKSQFFHDRLLDRVMSASVAFFENTPSGIILNLFAKHLYHVDDSIPDALMQALQYMPLAIGSLLVVVIFVPWMWAVTLGVVLLLTLMLALVRPAQRQCEEWEARTKPAVYTFAAATVDGVFCVRAYKAEDRFRQMFVDVVDTNSAGVFASTAINSFVSFFIDFGASLIIFFAALLVVLIDGEVTASETGLSISNALQLLVFTQWTVRMIVDIQTQIVSVQQLQHYSDTIPVEAGSAPSERTERTPPPAGWPTAGKIEFNKAVLRYRPFLAPALKKVTFTIQPGEKIGIVGRTGSGKSTLLVSLFRVVEICAGSIHIDGVDIGSLSLEDLRSRISIIPQEPILFADTIRNNLDPLGKCSDADIWQVLAEVNLADRVRSMADGLSTMVLENGKDISLGQRQLFCIARAMLSKTKVVVLDEATAAVDPQTDALIQDTIRRNFADKTVLTIAHRLDTIIESDRVMVLDGGRLMELEEPARLLANPDSQFYKLVHSTGADMAARLTDMAREASAKKAQQTSTLSPKQPRIAAPSVRHALPSAAQAPRRDGDSASAVDPLLPATGMSDGEHALRSLFMPPGADDASASY